MPVINRQLPPRAAKPASNGLPQTGDILDSGVPVDESYGPTNRICERCNKENEYVREYRVIDTKDVPK